MAITSNALAGTGENNAGIGATAWTSPGNVTADDTTDATCNAAASSQYLVARNFSFAIPSGAAILGVLFSVEASEHSTATEPLLGQLQNDSATLVGASKSTSNEGSISGTTKSVYTYGSATDTWGASLTSAIVNHANFGARFWFTTAHDVRVDDIRCQVTYTGTRLGALGVGA
jgi:hypothetical protein